MNPWSINPVWQNFSSLYREVAAAEESANEISRFHHLTSALYFGVSTIEAYLNRQLRFDLEASGVSEEKIFCRLRKDQFRDKLKKWPKALTNGSLGSEVLPINRLSAFADIRNDLTHQKTPGHEIYEVLDTIAPNSVIEAVAEYCIRIHEARNEEFPYWFLGWNYFNPRVDSQELWLLNNQQFSYSLTTLGLRVPAYSETWSKPPMRTYEEYKMLRGQLRSLKSCKPHDSEFPFRPVLCRAWWEAEHYRSCGRIKTDTSPLSGSSVKSRIMLLGRRVGKNISRIVRS